MHHCNIFYNVFLQEIHDLDNSRSVIICSGCTLIRLIKLEYMSEQFFIEMVP